METFLKPIIEHLKLLASEGEVCMKSSCIHAFYSLFLFFPGITVTVNNVAVTCKAKLLISVADLPAKASLTNCNQYNGQYGCQSCKQKGDQVSR